MANTVINFVDSRAYNTYKGFPEMTNGELYYIARREAINDEETTKREKLTRTMVKIVPVVDSVLAVSKKTTGNELLLAGSMASSMGTFGGRLLSWGALFFGMDILSKGTDKIISKSDKLSEINDNNPLLKGLLDVGLMMGAYRAAGKVVSNVGQSLSEVTRDEFVNNAKTISQKIDNSFISKKFYEPVVSTITKFTAKYPKIVSSVKAIQPYLIPGLIIASVVRFLLIDPLAFEKKVDGKFKSLQAKVSDS